ncbi:MAG: putative ABC transporter permease [Bacilli bacterium]
MFSTYFILFILYSFLGWCCEVTLSLIENKKFVNRGFLIGPYCPIYGWGCLLFVLFLSDYAEEPFALFALSIIICSILEYFTSWIMEKLFKMRWWDYSDMKFNINGRICLETMIPFGVAGVLVISFINPFVMNIINNIPSNIVMLIAVILAVLFIVDNIMSFNIIFNLKNMTKNLKKDSTEDIKKHIKNAIQNNKYLYNRLIKAFPGLKKIIIENKKRIKAKKKKLKEKEKLRKKKLNS